MPSAWGEQPLELHYSMLAGASLEELLEAAAAGGYRYLIVGPAHYAQARDRGVSAADIGRMTADKGVAISYMDGYPAGLPGTEAMPQVLGDDSSEDFIFEALDAFDASAVNLPHYRGTPVPRAMLSDAIAALSERARTRGRGVLLEFQPESGVPDFPAAIELLEAAGAPNASATLDTVQLYAAGGDVSQLTPERIARLGALQVADKKGPLVLGRIEERDRYTRELPGDGDIPLRDLLRRILPLRPDLPVGVEIFSHDLKARSYQDAAVLAAEATRRLLETV